MRGSTEIDDALLPAIVATGIWMGVGAALDAYLISTNRSRLITDVLRTKPGRAFLIVLCLHVVNVLGRADPFRAAAYTLQTRRGVPVLVPVPVPMSVLTDALTSE